MELATNTPEQLLSDLIQKLPLDVNKDKFRIFLFGPGLQVDEVVEEPNLGGSINVEEHAKYLRYYIAKELRSQGWLIDFGESPDVLALWEEFRGPIDSGSMEYFHAKEACGAIVILPSSVGSFCEMGMFATSKEISQKTLALIHQDFENAQSFFRRGLVRVFKARKGTCIYKPYHKKEAVLDAIQEFIEDAYRSHQWDANDISIGTRRKREKLRP